MSGMNILEINHAVGPFGSKDAPAFVKSVYNGWPGAVPEGENDHDVVWFSLKKSKPHKCPFCSRHFMLEVVGAGCSPDSR
ncbi:Cytochrome c oxidase subunit 5B, mitochondrial [Melia azedarach]|uniref:Cytochrome c oxidase subunit 5B, mitochondrial n=1 Tax=Melia azedarach TaxID=155640 RepID=A0ACC1XB49_MELAZ|nr:Cytochrome c oxidase subunit 5B, mitochondrial [Melia azedarach]